ncbi:hypothetical protein Tco_1294295 [Tanacetum coccineum]
MSEAEPIPPTSSVTALRIPMIKKGEYDLCIKARFGGNEASKKMQKNLLKQQFETFTIGSREELDSAYERSKMNALTVKVGSFCWRVQDFVIISGKQSNDSRKEDCGYLKIQTQKALVATDNNEDIDCDQGIDAETSDICICMALTELDQDDWSMEIDVEPVHFGQDGLGDFDWSNKADDTSVSLALMATNSESVIEVILKTHEKNEYAWGDKYEQMEYDLKVRDFKLEEKQKELDQVLKERDDFKVKLEKWTNASVLQNEVLNKQRYLSDNKNAKGFHAVPPPTGTVIPPRANVSFTGIDELAIRNKVVNQENTKSSQPEIDRNKVIIEDWVDSDDEETGVNFSEIQKKTVVNSENSETFFENSGCSWSMDRRHECYPDFKEFKGGYVAFGNDPKGGRITGKGTIKTSCIDFEKVSYVEELKFNLLSVSQICGSIVKNDVLQFGFIKNIIPSGGVTCLVAKATKDEAVLWHRRLGHVRMCRKGKQHMASYKKIEERTVREPLELFHMDFNWTVSERCDHGTSSRIILMMSLCKKESRENIVLQGLHSKMVIAERRIGPLIEAARTMLADFFFHIYFGHEAVNTACMCLKQRRISKTKGPDWMFDLELLNSFNELHSVRKENYADSGGNESTYDDVERFSSTAVYFHNDAQRNAFEKEKRRIALEKGKECVDSTFTLSTANTPSNSTGTSNINKIRFMVSKDSPFHLRSFSGQGVLPSSDDFSPIFKEKSVTFFNPLFDSNDDFTSSDDESLSDEDFPEDVKIYSNPLFEFDNEYISSDINPLFDEVLEDIECEDSYDSNLDESTFLVTPLSNSNEDEFFTSRDDIKLLLHHDPSISIVSILEGFIDEPPLEENDDLFYLEPKENDWKKIL